MTRVPVASSITYRRPDGSRLRPFRTDADYYLDRVAYDQDRFVALLELVKASTASGNRVLEIGAPPFILTTSLVDSGYEVTANALRFDVDGTVLELEVAGQGHEVPLAFFDAEDGLPFPDAALDCIVAGEVFEHFYRQPWHFLAEAWRCLRPGGALVMSTPNGHALEVGLGWLRRLNTGMGFNPDAPSVRHAREYSRAEMQELLESQGFDSVAITTANFNYITWQGGLRTAAKKRVHELLKSRAIKESGFLRDRGTQLMVLATKGSSSPQAPPAFMYYALGDPRTGWNFGADVVEPVSSAPASD